MKLWHMNKVQLPNLFCFHTQINYLLRTDTKVANDFLESYESPYLFSMSSTSAVVPATII